MEDIRSIHDYWFGSNPDDAVAAAEQAKIWWTKNPVIDAQMRARFRVYVEAAGRGELGDWAAIPLGRLALILLTDQFPRNIYRDTAQAFAFDPFALRYCREGIALGADRMLRPIERVFCYLPLEHSESLNDQHESVRLFSRLLEDVVPEHKLKFQGYLHFAIRHRDIIERFGRFPHRNRMLGRVSTAEEAAFLETPGSTF